MQETSGFQNKQIRPPPKSDQAIEGVETGQYQTRRPRTPEGPHFPEGDFLLACRLGRHGEKSIFFLRSSASISFRIGPTLLAALSTSARVTPIFLASWLTSYFSLVETRSRSAFPLFLRSSGIISFLLSDCVVGRNVGLVQAMTIMSIYSICYRYMWRSRRPFSFVRVSPPLSENPNNSGHFF